MFLFNLIKKIYKWLYIRWVVRKIVKHWYIIKYNSYIDDD